MSEPANPPATEAPATDSFAAAGPDVIAPGEGELIVIWKASKVPSTCC